MSTLTPRTSALVGLMAFSWLASARAAPCGRPDIDATFPPDQAQTVPPNASLAAHYASPATYDDEPVSLTDSMGAPVSATVRYDDADAMLRVVPEQALAQGDYRVEWPGLHGVSSSGVGRGKTTSFTVASDVSDAAPPVFAGLTDVSWDLARERDPCLDRLDDRFVFKLRVGRASDDAGVELLSLLAFQTRDPISPARTEPSNLGVHPWPSDGVLEVRRPATESGKTCFAAVVLDLVGNVSGGGEREVCVRTKKPPFFEGCAVAVPPGARGPQPAPIVGLLLAGLALLRRGRASHARAPRAG
jgi:methionine-rich copper-binding protein CopC